jgi:very-short-patch-repair endonuclease
MNKSCKYCGTTDNLHKDKLGRIYSLCKDCLILQGKKGAEKNLNKKCFEHKYILRRKNGGISNIFKEFFEEEYLYVDISLEALAKKYNTREITLLKYLTLYNLKEIKRCRHCGTDYNLLFLSGKFCKCCIFCWKKSYKYRKCRKKTKNTVTKTTKAIKSTSGIGIKAQFFFKDLENQILNRNIDYFEMQYGFFDFQNKKRICSEKVYIIKDQQGLKKSIHRFVDFYIKLKDREIIIEFDESKQHLNEDLDLEREKQILSTNKNLEIYRIKEEFIKNDISRKNTIFALLEIIQNKNFFYTSVYQGLYDYHVSSDLFDSLLEKDENFYKLMVKEFDRQII